MCKGWKRNNSFFCSTCIFSLYFQFLKRTETSAVFFSILVYTRNHRQKEINIWEKGGIQKTITDEEAIHPPKDNWLLTIASHSPLPREQ